MSPESRRASRRPLSLWLFSLVIFGIGIVNLALALDHTWHAGHYRDLGVSYPPLLRAALALAWALILLAASVSLIRRRRWAHRWILVILSNYGAFGVLWLIVFARSDFGRDRIPFQVAVTLALIVLAAWITRWRRIRAVFEPPAAPGPPHTNPNSGEMPV